MKRTLYLAVLTVFVLSSLITAVACGSNGQETPAPAPTPTPEPTPTEPVITPEPEPAASSDPYEIQFTDKGLVPKTLTIPVGTEVTWYNSDTRPNSRHWVKADDGSFDTRAIPWHARMTHTFNTPGVYNYQCLFHKDRDDEKGTIIVE